LGVEFVAIINSHFAEPISKAYRSFLAHAQGRCQTFHFWGFDIGADKRDGKILL